MNKKRNPSDSIGYIRKEIPKFDVAAGDRYEVLAPDTLDLAEHASLAVNALTNLRPDAFYAYIPTAEIRRQGGYASSIPFKAWGLPGPFAPELEKEIARILDNLLGWQGPRS